MVTLVGRCSSLIKTVRKRLLVYLRNNMYPSNYPTGVSPLDTGEEDILPIKEEVTEETND
jgi:hypothetical protein